MLLVNFTLRRDSYIPQAIGKHEADPQLFSWANTAIEICQKMCSRKKLSERAIKQVERGIERLLKIDATVKDVQYSKGKKKTDDREIELDTTTQKVDINDSVDESEIDENLAGDINYKFEEMENEEDIENENKEDNGDESQKGHLKQTRKIGV